MRIRILALLTVILLPLVASALSFASSSVLSSGRWVKIAVKQSGIYELSYKQLSGYGFSHPENVKIYGMGGNMASENYLLPYADDLQQTPVLHEDNKIYFYAKGVVSDSIVVENSAFYYYSVTNTYSSCGAYFLTEDTAEKPLLVRNADLSAIPSGVEDANSGLAVWFEEAEMYNPGLTGRNFLGENISRTAHYSRRALVDGIVPDMRVYISATLAMKGDSKMTARVSVSDVSLSSVSGNTLAANGSVDYLEYGVMNLTGQTTVGATDVLDLAIDIDGSPLEAWVDKLAVVYRAENSLPTDASQVVRYMVASAGSGAAMRVVPSSDRFKVWKVYEQNAFEGLAYDVQNCGMRKNADGSMSLYDNMDGEWVKYVLFDTSRPQLSPDFVGEVPNQNLHSSTTPDMLVITNADLMNYAEKLADYHRSHDGMDVLVVDQNAIFNEFSSGIRDAMAYRRFCKMLYDRNPDKFKYLLLFGLGIYDNRKLNHGGDTDYLLTWQSEDSYSQVRSYSSDDFFSFLDDTNTSLQSRNSQISVGRIPVISATEAETYMEKLLSYLGSLETEDVKWLNNVMVVGENGDDYVHVEQCETFMGNFQSSGLHDMNFSKVYLAAYRSESDARTKFVENLNAGQNLCMFVGHGNPFSITMSQSLYTLATAKTTSHPRFPIFYFSTCDVARYDNGNDNLVKSLLLNEKGGLIAAVASTRVVYTNLNGRMTDSFAKSLSKTDDYYNGQKTLGAVLKDAKNNSGDATINHLKYHLIGDPAMPLSLPLNRVALTTVNGQDVSTDGTKVDVALQDKVSVAGVVRNNSGNVDANFNGNVEISLFDSERDYMKATITVDDERKTVTLKEPGALLAKVSAMAVNGRFSGDIHLPGYATSTDALLLRMVACSDGKVCSGSNTSLRLDRSSSVNGVSDNEPPTISAMYIDDKETFKDGMEVSSDFTVLASVHDNVGLNCSSDLPLSSMSLLIDGGKWSYKVLDYTPGGSGGGLVKVPVYDLWTGWHTAELIVTDLSGNVASKTISFYVVSSDVITLSLSDTAAVDAVTVSVEGIDGYDGTDMELFVADDAGDILFRKSVSSFPFDWDLRGNDGEKLQPGCYDIYAVVAGIGTKSKKIIVLEQ